MPFESQLPHGDFGVGKKLLISGVPEKKAKEFEINFLGGVGEKKFSFKVPLGEKHIVRNALVCWFFYF